jgi:hypothetical protein
MYNYNRKLEKQAGYCIYIIILNATTSQHNHKDQWMEKHHALEELERATL